MPQNRRPRTMSLWVAGRRRRLRAGLTALALLVACAGAAAVAAKAEAFSFMPTMEYPVGARPTSIVADDFNNDGTMDLAVVNDYDADIGVLLGIGGGAFGAATHFPTGSSARFIGSADFDADGDRDLVTADYEDSAVSVLLGDGRGGFAPRTSHTVCGDPYTAVVADLNGDGKPDIAAGCNATPNAVSVLLGDGGGGFAAKRDFPCASPFDLAAADLDGDGNVDLVSVAAGADAVSVLPGDGSGGFGSEQLYPTGDFPSSVAVDDFNADGEPDAVTVNSSAGTVSVLLGDGSGGFGPHADFAVGARACGVAVADFDGDGRRDLAVADWQDGVYVLLGNGSGRFGSPTLFPVATSAHSHTLSVRDLNGDGRPDLAAATGNPGLVGVLLQPPALSIGAPTASSLWPSGSTQTVSWTIAAPVFSGEFRVWLISSAGAWYVAKQVVPAANYTSYSTQIGADVPAASGYRAAVYWRPVAGSGAWLATAKSAAFTVTPINITSPMTSTLWPVNTTQTIGWTVNPSVSTGEFRVWLISSSGTWYINRQVLAVEGKTSYALSVSTAVPPGSGYKAAVYWRPVVGSGGWVATTKSGPFSVAALVVTDPVADSSWPRAGTRAVSWTVTPAVSGGEFRVWLVSPSGGWYVGKQVLPVLLRTSYSTLITYNVPPGVGYRAAVYWRRTLGVPPTWILTAKSAGFTVSP